MAIKIEDEYNTANKEIVDEKSENKQGSWIVNKLESYFYW